MNSIVNYKGDLDNLRSELRIAFSTDSSKAQAVLTGAIDSIPLSPNWIRRFRNKRRRLLRSMVRRRREHGRPRGR